MTRDHATPAPDRRVFDPEFLHLFERRDDSGALAGAAAEAAGPWRVLPSPPDGWGCYALGRPGAELGFRDREMALLAAAALPGCAAPPRSAYGETDESGRIELVAGGRRMGSARVRLGELPTHLDALRAVIENPASLAYLLEAAGPAVLERAGAILLYRLTRER